MRQYAPEPVKIFRSVPPKFDKPARHEARAVCRAAIALGLAFGLRIVAEGIETEAQAQFLVAEQCHEGQGHLFAPASPLATLLEKILPAGKTAPASVNRASQR